MLHPSLPRFPLLTVAAICLTACAGSVAGAPGDGAGGDHTQRADGGPPGSDVTVPDGGEPPGSPLGDAGAEGGAGDPGAPPSDTDFPPPRSWLRPAIEQVAAASGVIDHVSESYQYAPEFLFIGGAYHFWDCWGVSGDYVGYKSAPSLAGLPGVGLWPSLIPSAGEHHTCDPSVVRGGDGKYYLHYSYLPDGYATWAGVAVADAPGGPWWKLGATVGSQPLAAMAPGQYGRGQTSITRGHDDAYYMLFTNQIAPVEEHSIVLVRSLDASFRSGVTEVARYNPGLIAGWSADLTYDPALGKYYIAVPVPEGTRLNIVSTAFVIEGHVILAGPNAHKESQSILGDEYGRVLRRDGRLILASGQPGPRDHLWATSPATGAMFWQAHNTKWTGLVSVQDFESKGPDGWEIYGAANRVNYEDAKAFGGTRVLAFNKGGGGSLQRNHPFAVEAGNGFMASAMVKAETATATGNLCVWLLGKTANESGCTRYSVTREAWTSVVATVEASSPHDTVRVEFYPDAGTTRIDNARLEATVSSQNFERGGTDGWAPLEGASIANHKADALAHGGARVFAFHAGAGGKGSVIRDARIGVSAGTSWSAAAMVRAESPSARGSFCIWLLGVNPNESKCIPYNVTDQGWTRLEAVVNATGTHDRIRVQFYPSEGVTRIDDVVLR